MKYCGVYKCIHMSITSLDSNFPTVYFVTLDAQHPQHLIKTHSKIYGANEIAWQIIQQLILCSLMLIFHMTHTRAFI